MGMLQPMQYDPSLGTRSAEDPLASQARGRLVTSLLI